MRSDIRVGVAARPAQKSGVKVRFQTATPMFVLMSAGLLRLSVLSILAQMVLALVGRHLSRQRLFDGAARVVHARLGRPGVGRHCVSGASVHESCH